MPPNTVEVDASDSSYKSTIKYDDVDLAEYSDDELLVLGLSQDEIDSLRGVEPEEDEEEEEEEEPEEVEEEEEEEKPESKKREPRIPKSRFDEAVMKEREKAIRAEEKSKYLEQRIEELLSLHNKVVETKDPEPEYDFEAAEESYANYLIEGETSKAAKLRMEMNKERDKYIQSLISGIKEEAKSEVEKSTTRLSEKQKKDIVIQEALTNYPFLDAEHEDFNEELVEEINILASGFESRSGLAPAEALTKALNRLVKDKSVKSTKTERAKKKIDSMRKQPPNTASAKSVTDKDSTDFDWESMSQEEFRELYKKSPKLVSEALRKNYSK